jgi:transcriptional regulator with XRE-family HTH domain
LRHRALIAALDEARERAGLTQRQLAAKLRRSDSFVWKYEAGERRIDVLEFMDIAKSLGIEATELLAQALR